MRALFVYPTPDHAQIFHHGIGHLSAVLTKQGHQTALLVATTLDRPAITSTLSSFNPQLICVTSATNQILLTRELIRSIYEQSRLPIILGGVHASFSPEECIAFPGIMAACIGEGEGPLLELVQAMEANADFTSISSLWFSGGHSYRYEGTERTVPGRGVIRNEVRVPNKELDQLPFPDRELFAPYTATEERFDFMTGRGCPFSCHYCFHEQYRRLFPAGQRYCRRRGVDHVMEEIRAVRARFPRMRSVNFHDDTFNASRPWLQEFVRSYREQIGLPFECSLEAHLADEETLKSLAEAGCFHVFIGVETGNEKLRREVLNKKVSNAELERTFAWARKHGLETTAHYMVGIPYETRATIEESIDMARRLRPDVVSPTIFYPFAGTALFELCRERGWMSQRNAASYYYGSILDQPSISHLTVERYRLLFSRMSNHTLLYGVCRWAPMAFVVGSALRELQRLKRALKAAAARASRARQEPEAAIPAAEIVLR